MRSYIDDFGTTNLCSRLVVHVYLDGTHVRVFVWGHFATGYGSHLIRGF
jgi:hypothetical protein